MSKKKQTEDKPKWAGKPENLVQYSPKYSEEEKIALCSKGGTNAGINKRRARTLRVIAAAMLEAKPLETDEIYQELQERGLGDTYAEAMMLSVLSKALHGDVEAARFVRDTAGQKPTDQVQVGNLDGVPFMRKEMAGLSDEALLAMIREAEEE